MGEIIPPQMRQRVILYTRVSSDQQVSNTSLDEQERIGREYCESRDYDVVRVFREEGESAKYLDRTELLNAIEYCANKSNKIDIFLVYKMDRFSRNLENHLHIKKILRGYGVRLVSMTEVLDDTPSGVLFENILASFAQFDNDQKRERVINGMIAKLKKGIWVWRCPPGYARDNKLMVRDPQRWDIISDSWQWFNSGKYSQLEVVSYLNDMGYISAQGGKANKDMVSKMYRNPLYMGKVVAPNFNIEADGIHEPMVTKQMFYEVQDLLDGVKTKYNANPSFVVNRTFVCESCGYFMSGAFSRGKYGTRYGYYSCTNYQCRNKARMPQEALENTYLNILSGYALSPNIAQEVRDKVIIRIKKIGLEEHKRITSLQTQIAQLSNSIDKIEHKLDIGFYEPEEAVNKKRELEKKITTLEIEREKSSIQNYHIESVLDYCTKFLEHLPEIWKTLDTSDKLALNRFVFPDGIKVGKNVSSNPRINPLFVEIDALVGDSIALGDPKAPFLEHLLQLFNLLKSFNLSFNF